MEMGETSLTKSEIIRKLRFFINGNSKTYLIATTHFFYHIDANLTIQWSIAKAHQLFRHATYYLLRDFVVISILAKRQLHYKALYGPVPWHAL